MHALTGRVVFKRSKYHEDVLFLIAETFRHQSSAMFIFLKLAEEGILIQATNGHGNDWVTDSLRAFNTAPKDVARAVDSLLITNALTLESCGSIFKAACLGSLAAAV